LVSEWHSEFDETWYWVDIPISYGDLDLDYQGAFIKGQGLTDMLLEGTVELGPYSSFGIMTVFTDGPTLKWELAQFTPQSQVGNLDLEANALFTDTITAIDVLADSQGNDIIDYKIYEGSVRRGRPVP